MKKYTRIIGTGSYLPEKILTNADLERMVDTSDQWITDRTGIKTRHIAAENETLLSMVHTSAQRALENAKVDKDEIDLIIVATCTPDHFFPSMACLVQQSLGIKKNLIAFDVSVACAGFIYALSIADHFIRAGTVQKALVIGGELLSRIVDWNDRNTCILFGDGAGAIVVQSSTSPGIIDSNLSAQGEYKDLLFLDNGQTLPKHALRSQYVCMQGHEIFKLAVNKLYETVEKTIDESEYQRQDIDWLVPHQANLRIIKALAKKLNMPIERVILTIEGHGNTSAASIPLALDKGMSDGRIKSGDLILFEALGGGLAWGSMLVKI